MPSEIYEEGILAVKTVTFDPHTITAFSVIVTVNYIGCCVYGIGVAPNNWHQNSF